MKPSLLYINMLNTDPEKIGWFSEFNVVPSDGIDTLHLSVNKHPIHEHENVYECDSFLLTIIKQKLIELNNIEKIEANLIPEDVINRLVSIANRFRIKNRHSPGRVVYISKKLSEKLRNVKHLQDNKKDCETCFSGFNLGEMLTFIECEYVNFNEMIMFTGSDRHIHQPFHCYYDDNPYEAVGNMLVDRKPSNRLTFSFNLENTACLIKLNPSKIKLDEKE